MNGLKVYDEAPIAEAGAPNERRWYPILKRAYDVFFAVVGLVLLAPLGVILGAIIKLSDRGPILYRQRRIGQHGKPFVILKFRTMRVDADKQGPSVTKDQDPRITRIGRILRKVKLDELPQLWNVLNGSMSFVGPRPEVPRYVDRYTPEQRQLLDHKPGITDLATLAFRNEEILLRNADNVEEFYVQHCIPRKFRLNLRYAKNANLWEDTLIVIETLCPYWFGIVCGYILALVISLWLSYLLRFDFQVPKEGWDNLKTSLVVVVAIQMAFLFWRKHLGGLLSFFDVTEMKQLAYGLGLAGAVQLFVWYVTDGSLMPGRSIIMVNCMMAFVMLAGIRTLLRHWRLIFASRIKQNGDTPGTLRVGIVGAGELGAWLARQLNSGNNDLRRVEVFFDDDAGKWHQQLCGLPVIGMPECILDGSWAGKLDEVVLAIPNASPERAKQILDILASAKIRAHPLSSLHEILAK